MCWATLEFYFVSKRRRRRTTARNELFIPRPEWSVQLFSALCTSQFQNRPFFRPPPPPGQTPEYKTFLKNFGEIPRYVASIDGQMPHPLELQRGSNQSSRENRIAYNWK